jgi:hypothetical protein
MIYEDKFEDLNIEGQSPLKKIFLSQMYNLPGIHHHDQ